VLYCVILLIAGHLKMQEILNQEKFSLKRYIQQNYKNQKSFAEFQGFKAQHVSKMISDGFLVVNDVLYSPRRGGSKLKLLPKSLESLVILDITDDLNSRGEYE